MTQQFIFAVVVTAAAVFGLFAGRVIAAEGQNRLSAVFAGTYVGAGAGLVSAITMGSLLVGIAQFLNEGSSTWFDALEVAGKSLLWGTAGGAAAGLAVSMVIAALNLGRQKEDA